MNKIVFKAVTDAAQRREELGKKELSSKKVELGKTPKELLNESRSANLDGFDVLAELSNFAQKTEDKFRKKQQANEELMKDISDSLRVAKEWGFDDSEIKQAEQTVKNNLRNLNSFIKIAQRAK